jgi:large subunit ribosomal protein L13
MNESMKTYMARKGEITHKWYVVDATDKVLGRIATRIAMILMGKHRPEYTPHVDTGDFVIVVNADKVKVTGKSKPDQRVYKSYSRYPGGLKIKPFREMFAKHPDIVVQEAVRRMLPKNPLGRAMASKLKVYAGPDHPHKAQQPEKLEL